MDDKEKQLIADLRPRLDNWRRAYRDKVIKNISITYAVQRALALTRNKTDFSEDYTGPEDRSDDYGIEVDQKDADLLNTVWQYMSTPDTEMLTIGTHGLNVRTAKLIVLLYVFGEVDQKDADLLNTVWQYMSTPDTEMLTIGTHGLNVRTAKLIVLLYVFGSDDSLRRAGKKIWNIKRAKVDTWTEDALLFFAMRIRVYTIYCTNKK